MEVLMTMTTVESRTGFFSSRAANVLLATVLAAAAGIGGAALVTSGALKGVLGTPAAVTAPAMEIPHPAPPSHPVLPRMQLQAQYAGPLQDTVVQRLRDPVDGTVCYVFLPIAVHHTPANSETGYVDYGANSIGSISCYQAAPVMRAPVVRAPAPRAVPAP
jgi:hypothetical protein